MMPEEKDFPRLKSWRILLWLSFLVLAFSVVVACTGRAGAPGPSGPPGTSTGTVSGTVTNSPTGKPVAGVTVTPDPAISGVTIQTDATGKYSSSLPIGAYTLTYKRDNFASATQTVSLVAGQTVTKDVVLKATSLVGISAGAAQKGPPGGTVTLTAKADLLDGSQVTGYQWAQTFGVPATLDNPRADSVKVTLGSLAAYKAELFKHLRAQDRFGVQAINPLSLEEAEKATFKVTVTTSSGSYSGSVDVMADLPYAVSLGLQNVPKGILVLLHGKSQSAHNWTLVGPAGFRGALDDPKAQNPSFT